VRSWCAEEGRTVGYGRNGRVRSGDEYVLRIGDVAWARIDELAGFSSFREKLAGLSGDCSLTSGDVIHPDGPLGGVIVF
jgi:hypothetical protein